MVTVNGIEMTLSQAMLEVDMLTSCHRRLDLVRADLDHSPDLDDVDTPELSDQCADLLRLIEERELAIKRYEGDELGPPRNRGGARL